MKFSLAVVLLALSSVCWGWNCPAGEIRQQAPAGTATNTPYYDVVEGIAFICVPTPTPSTGTGTVIKNNNKIATTNTNTNANTNSNTLTNNNTNNISNTLAQQQAQQQKQNQTQTATGGNAISTSQGGNAASTSSAANNGNGSNNSTTNTNVAAPNIPVNTAIAPPALPSAPCIKGYGGAVQTGLMGGSFGGGKIDDGCDDRELARSFAGPQTLASCKILVATKKAKKAGVTLADCLKPIAPEPVVQVIPAPVVEVVVLREVPALPVVALAPPEPPVVAKKRVVRKRKPCPTPEK